MSDRADRFTAIIDTDVLVGALTRNMILSLAEAGIFRPRWSCQTLIEFETVFARAYPNKDVVAAKQRASIERAFPEGVTAVSDTLIEGLTLPDPDDRHVLAAAIMTKASVIVTNNLRDFPQLVLSAYEIEALSADDFIADCIDLGQAEALAALRTMRERLRSPTMDPEALIKRIEQCGLIQTAKILEPWKALI